MSQQGPVQRRAFSVGRYFHSPSLEETGIRGVLLDIGGIVLFGGIHLAFVFAISLLISALSRCPCGFDRQGHGWHFFVT